MMRWRYFAEMLVRRVQTSALVRVLLVARIARGRHQMLWKNLMGSCCTARISNYSTTLARIGCRRLWRPRPVEVTCGGAHHTTPWAECF